jgi:hypothetical protein
MTLREILEYVVTQTSTAWHVPQRVGAGAGPPPLALYALGEVWTDKDGRYIEIKTHHSFAVNLERPEVSLAWGLPVGHELDPDAFPFSFPDNRFETIAADVLLNGFLVERRSLLVVDGGRAALPWPDYAFGPRDDEKGYGEVMGDTVTDWDYRFANLLHELEGGVSEFESYFNRTGIVRGQAEGPIWLNRPPPQKREW